MPWYNDRLLMFALRHHDPDRYGRNSGGTASVPPHVRRALRAEWEADRAEQERRERDPVEVRKRIMAKIAEVRRIFGDHDELVDGPDAPDGPVPADADEAHPPALPFPAAAPPDPSTSDPSASDPLAPEPGVLRGERGPTPRVTLPLPPAAGN